MQAKVKPARLRVSARSVLVINAPDVAMESLVLDGALVVDAVPGASVTIDGLSVDNSGWKWMALKPDKPMKEEWAIRWGLLAGGVSAAATKAANLVCEC